MMIDEVLTIANWYQSLNKGFADITALQYASQKMASYTVTGVELVNSAQQVCDAAKMSFESKHAEIRYDSEAKPMVAKSEADYKTLELKREAAAAKTAFDIIERQVRAWKNLSYEMRSRVKSLEEEFKADRIEAIANRKYA